MSNTTQAIATAIRRCRDPACVGPADAVIGATPASAVGSSADAVLQSDAEHDPIVKQHSLTGALAVDESKKRGTQPHPFWDFWGPVLFMMALYLGIRQFLVEARYIPSGSMLPGLQIQDRLLVEKLTDRSRSPKRGDIVVFNSYAFDPAL